MVSGENQRHSIRAEEIYAIFEEWKMSLVVLHEISMDKLVTHSSRVTVHAEEWCRPRHLDLHVTCQSSVGHCEESSRLLQTQVALEILENFSDLASRWGVLAARRLQVQCCLGPGLRQHHPSGVVSGGEG